MAQRALRLRNVLLLERADLLARLRAGVEDARAGSGALIAVSGEAGAGKTSLVRQALVTTSAVWGYCEPLATPRPLGPFRDIARQLWADSAESPLGITDLREQLFDWMQRGPVPLVVEDAHWIDAASADVLRFLGRRIEASAGLIVLTYRDELSAEHPLRPVLGELVSAAGVTRLVVPPLSGSAVAQLVAGSRVDGDEALRLTSGNPFLVSQLVLAPDDRVGTSVRDSVIARISRLSPSTRTVVELLSVMPGRIDAALLGPDWSDLDEAVLAGLVQVDGAVVEFRHELVRMAVEQALTPGRRRELHIEVLERLSQLDGAEPATIAYHARRAHDVRRALTSERLAAERALALGSNHEAAEHYRRAIADATSMLPASERSRLRLALSQVESSIGRDRSALDEARKAFELARSGADLSLRSATVRWLSRATPVEDEGYQLAQLAVETAESIGPSRELAAAYALLATNRMLARDLDAARTLAERAIALATEFDDTESAIVALQALGSALLLDGQADGGEHLRRAIALAADAGLHAELGRAYSNLVSAAGEARLYQQSADAAEEALNYFVARDLDGPAGYTRAWHARCLFEQGYWEQAAVQVDAVLGAADRNTANTRLAAWCISGRIRARRGEPAVWSPLDAALPYAEHSGSLQRIAPIAAARAEARWLSGEPDDGAAGLEAAYLLAIQRSNRWAIGELGFWLWRHGMLETLPATAAEPYRLHVAGDPVAAGHAWLELGCRYEAADAFCDAGDEASVRAALELFTALGAKPGRLRAARRLREIGVRAIPRGPRDATALDPYGLTPREREVLSWLRTGHTDAEIATKLQLSTKTVGHHVSAVLRKTSSRSRRELFDADSRTTGQGI
ncbi:MAG: transcriptional regulator, LuxR family [Frankiales bacterium]|nr:transcriptional regulator, LuxR family [Frankiales bacterium]